MTNRLLPEISRAAAYRREDYLFQREQSPTLRALDWETRIVMPEPYWRLIGGIGGWVLLGFAVLRVIWVFG